MYILTINTYISAMRKTHLYEPFSINVKIMDRCPMETHMHSFFQLVHIVSGTGRQHINQSEFEYKQGHLFLITPKDRHFFDVETTTKFFFLEFNNIYIKSKGLHTENIQRLEYILQNANHKPGCILKNERDRNLVTSIIQALLIEDGDGDLYDKEITQQLINTLIVVVGRNIAKYLPEKINASSQDKIVGILNYIQANIYHPDKIRTESICEHFNISNNYLGRYFKKHCGETMQSYITRYKTSLIAHRLEHSDKRINELVFEFGFTDESHLSRFFKKQKDVGPKVYRQRFQQEKQLR